MNKNKLWTIGAVIVMVAVIAGGWVIGIQPQLAAVASANQNRANVEVQNATNEALLARLKRDYEGIDGLKNQLGILRTAVPADAEMSTFVTELNGLANTHGITVKSITVTDAKPYTPATMPSNGTPQAGVTTNPKITSANFVVIPVQFSITGTYAKVLDFVHDVQTGPRLFLVSTLSSTGSTHSTGGAAAKTASATASGTVDSTVGGFVYVLLDTGKK